MKMEKGRVDLCVLVMMTVMCPLALDKVKHDDDDRRLYAHSMEHLVREQLGICSTDLLTAFSWHRWLAVPKEAARWLVGAVGGDAHHHGVVSSFPAGHEAVGCRAGQVGW